MSERQITLNTAKPQPAKPYTRLDAAMDREFARELMVFPAPFHTLDRKSRMFIMQRVVRLAQRNVEARQDGLIRGGQAF